MASQVLYLQRQAAARKAWVCAQLRAQAAAGAALRHAAASRPQHLGSACMHANHGGRRAGWGLYCRELSCWLSPSSLLWKLLVRASCQGEVKADVDVKCPGWVDGGLALLNTAPGTLPLAGRTAAGRLWGLALCLISSKAGLEHLTAVLGRGLACLVAPGMGWASLITWLCCSMWLWRRVSRGWRAGACRLRALNGGLCMLGWSSRG